MTTETMISDKGHNEINKENEENKAVTAPLSEANSSASDKKYRQVRLINEAYLTLRSRIARYYFYKGGDKNGGGVFYFNKQVREIWYAAEQDDPYADLFLLRIYDALITTRREIRQKIKYYQDYIQGEVNLQWKIILSDEPIKIKLNFMLSYGYMAADLIADFDNFACLIYSGKMLGVMLDKPINDLLQQIGDKIKATFELPQKWIKIEVTREDIQQNNDRAKFACEHMGLINEKVLTGELRAPFSPKIKKSAHKVIS